jgi:hypothetical protein
MVDVDEMNVKRLLHRFEHEIVGINQKNISDIAGNIGIKELLRIGSKISICRAQYLKQVLEMSCVEDVDITPIMVDEMKRQRIRYDELQLSFDALCHALQRGYIVVKEG